MIESFLTVLEVRSPRLRSSGVSFWSGLSSLPADSRLLAVSSQYVCMERHHYLPLLMWPPTPLDWPLTTLIDHELMTSLTVTTS